MPLASSAEQITGTLVTSTKCSGRSMQINDSPSPEAQARLAVRPDRFGEFGGPCLSHVVLDRSRDVMTWAASAATDSLPNGLAADGLHASPYRRNALEDLLVAEITGAAAEAQAVRHLGALIHEA